MSREEVKKYYEVRISSLAIVAIMICFLFAFLSVLFTSRGQYIYAVIMAMLMVIMILAAMKLLRYVRTLRKA